MSPYQSLEFEAFPGGSDQRACDRAPAADKAHVRAAFDGESTTIPLTEIEFGKPPADFLEVVSS